jgi:acyl-coenzyme A synthetase/AMP-(fatty) acid ligase
MTLFYSFRRMTRHATFFQSAQYLSASRWQMQQQRSVSTSNIDHSPPDVEGIYHKLLNHPVNAAPLECNFISQVVDHWATPIDRLAIRSIDTDAGTQEEITYRKLVDRSQQIAHFFSEQGFKKGDSVALMLGQHPAWWYSLAGLMRQGIAVVPCSRLLTPKDLSYRITGLNIKGIITTPKLQERVDSIRYQCPSLTHQLTTGIKNAHWDSLSDVFKQPIVPITATTTTKSPCLYLYTSGTTGQPKAVQHNQGYPFFHLPTGKNWLQATPDDLIYNASDTGWGFTVWITLGAWAMGAKLLINPTNKKFNPQTMLTMLRDQSVTIFCAAPTVLRLLVAEPNFDQFDLSNLKRIVTVGEALDETVIDRFTSHGIDVAVGFGQAETPLLTGRIDEQPHIANTMGKPIDPYCITVLDEYFQPSLPGHIGQIAVDLEIGRRGGLMYGYADAPERTRNAFSPNGRYYLTGDHGKKNEDGSLTHYGRGDDVIKSRGYRIGPSEVESAGMSHPAVAKIAVVGVRTQLDSHAITVKAFILLKPDHSSSPELIKSIQNHIKQETAPYKYPRLVEFLSLEEWNKYETTSGKIRRKALRELEETKLTSQQAIEEETVSSPPRPR